MGLFRRYLDQKNQYKRVYEKVKDAISYDPEDKEICAAHCPFYLKITGICTLFSNDRGLGSRSSDCVKLFGED